MKRIFFFASACLLFQLFLCAQVPDKNIIIKNATEEYAFVKGDHSNPVKIKQELAVSYFCKDYRTDVQIAEFYNDETELNDVNVKVDGNKIKDFKPTYDYYSSDGIFYSDARVCHFSLPFWKKGSKGDVVFKKTVLDPRYFTSIFFTEGYEIAHKEVSISVPKWMKVEIKEYNFKGYIIRKKVENKSNEDIYTWTIENAPAFHSELNAQGASFTAPHLLILAKYAEPDGSRLTYFNTLDDQYKWYRQLVNQIGNDPLVIKTKTDEIIKGINGDVERVKAIYQWVQNNIRYIAYEDGVAGFKPEKAQEVLRKKYGDCKGMGNLMAEMLKAIGLDGRKCWLGTNHIAYDYSTPSLCVDNHMICAWLFNSKTYFLDPTEKYIGFAEIAERIQGRQILIENGDQYILQRIPLANAGQNISYEKRTLAISGNNLVGKVIQTWKGENKEWMLTAMHGIKTDRQEDAVKQFLSADNSNYQISNLKIINLNDYNADLRIEYDLILKDAVTTLDKEYFMDIDNRKDFGDMKFDTSKRKLPYQFSFKDHIIFETELQIPSTIKIGNLPSSLKVDRPEYSMSGVWSVKGTKINYHREIQINKTLLSTDQFSLWNSDVKELNEFYNNQLAISQ